MRYVFILLLLAGCTKKWTHPEYTPERFQQDDAACADSALEMTNKGSRRSEKGFYNSCMQGKGWSRTILEPIK